MLLLECHCQHPNLVKLVGYCAEDDERGIQRLLVYKLIYFLSLCTLVFLFFNVSPLSRFHGDNLFNNTITYLNETCRSQGASIFCPNVSLHFCSHDPLLLPPPFVSVTVRIHE
ncbi:hypothetical protein CsatA_009934 [Cannabis sativa]